MQLHISINYMNAKYLNLYIKKIIKDLFWEYAEEALY